MSERPIIGFLRRLQGDRLFVKGDCLLSGSFSQLFIQPHVPFRPIFILLFQDRNEKLILIPGGDIQQFGDREYMSSTNLSVRFSNIRPPMYIVQTADCSKDGINCFTRDLREGSDFIETERGRHVTEIGLIQWTVIKVEFIATFQHEDAHAGTFTLRMY